MQLDLSTTPFSRYGSYLAVSQVKADPNRPAGLYLRTVHGDATCREVFRIELLGGKRRVRFDATADASRLRLAGSGGAEAEIVFADPQVVRLRVRGASLRLTLVTLFRSQILPGPDGRFHAIADRQSWQFMISPLAGQIEASTSFDAEHQGNPTAELELTPPAGEWGEVAIEEFRSAWRPREYRGPFDKHAADAQRDFEAFVDRLPPVPAKYAVAHKLAGYIDWSCVVRPHALLERPGMLMSKNWMTNLWSWDNCFNALALSYGQAKLAWDQFMAIFDRQDELGAPPDFINDTYQSFKYVKPPIHGWTLRKLMARGWLTRRHLGECYAPLCAATDWWFAYRDYDHDGVPQYNHGNDSGWDNATSFDVGNPVEGPDLLAFLAIQMEVLGDVAERLGKKREASEWRRRSEESVGRLMEHFWDGEQFRALASGTHVAESDGDCLLNFMPLLLGERLDAKIRRKLVAGLKRPGRFLTDHGLATESPRSPKYQADGYWRGPIWAPSTMLLVDGLAACGEDALARRVVRRFADMCAANGFAENYDALSGAGLRDRAYTWTASVFLVLAHEYL